MDKRFSNDKMNESDSDQRKDRDQTQNHFLSPIEVLNEKILKITLIINSKFPELLKFLGEMPVESSLGEQNDISLKEMQNYYLSLEAVLSKYTDNHHDL